MGRFQSDLSYFRNKLQREGIKSALVKSVDVMGKRFQHAAAVRRNPEPPGFVDVLFVNGCAYSLPHPIRYRVDHQIEQLESAGLSTKKIDAWDLSLDNVGDARNIIIFRCPWTSELGDFISLAKRLNKAVYFDIDDLVIDLKYTDTIPYLKEMTKGQRERYDEEVRLMGKTLRACGSAITTTEGMARELSKYVSEVFINRNVASDAMVHFSDQALFERDYLPSLDENQVPANMRHAWNWANGQARERANGRIRIGYFSGSITHNDDFEMILPALRKLLFEYENVELFVMGELDIPDELKEFEERIVAEPFCEWEKLPRLIARCDINIAPLRQTIFNEAKSENKWVEAALVKVPTVASRVGAFETMIKDGYTGLLCGDNEEWFEKLALLVSNSAKRQDIGSEAFEWCRENAVTIGTGHALASYLRSRQSDNVMISLPTMNTTGGVLVAFRHASILQDAGKDVFINDGSGEKADCLYEFDGHQIPIRHLISRKNKEARFLLRGSVDLGVASLWATLEDIRSYPNVRRVAYLVQNYETDFYLPADPLRIAASATYERQGVEYLTISEWCKDWLENRFRQNVRFAQNGLKCDAFSPAERDYTGKIRVLIEGNSESEYKNVDEAFLVTGRLDPEKYEIWYMSYQGKPKKEYRLDKFLHDIPHEKVADVYRQCNILLKTSILESFSYPPLEMMATGGQVVVIINDGNREYLRDGENCLAYPQGDIDKAVSCIERIVEDGALREHLRRCGLKTARARDWNMLKDQVLNLYE